MPTAASHEPSNADLVATQEASAIARLVEELGRPAMGDAVLGFLRTQSVFDSALLLLYQPKRRPQVLLEALAHPLRSNDIEAYLAGAYLLDPFRMHAQSLRASAVVRLQDITSEDFRSGEYFRSYYVASHLVDEVNFLIPVTINNDSGPGSGVVAICLGRSQSLTPFDDAEIGRFHTWLPLLSAVLARHVALPGAIDSAPASELEDREHARLEARLATFGSGSLTPREHEVVQHLLLGISASDIAARLSVSLQTVRVHRRNIYEKLDVSSLGQLFSLAMRSLLAGG